MSLIKKSILPLLFITLVSFSANANPVDMRTAREVTVKFVNANMSVPLRDLDDNIVFLDSLVKAICVANWDTSGDGELSYTEAAAVTDLGAVFSSNSEITSFEELQYFVGLTTISERAFYYCTGLTGSLIIPNSVTSIGENAFRNCSGLTGSLVIPSSVTTIGPLAFQNCSGFDGELIIPNSVTTIGRQAFLGCSSLTGNLVIPNSVTSIGNQAFQECSGFTGALVIPNALTSISNYVFNACSGLTSISIHDSVTSIGVGAFGGCSGFTGSLVVPESVISIGSGAFSGCDCLTGVYYSGNLGQWCNITFGWAPILYSYDLYIDGVLLNELVIPETVMEIKPNAFNYVTSLTSVIIPNSVTSIGESAFSGCINLNTVNLPNSLTTIGNSAFYGCSALITVDLPNSLTTIGNSAFYGCSALIMVDIPDSVTSIGNSAFSDCSSLTEVTIGTGMTTVGGKAFWKCPSLLTVYFNAINCTNMRTMIYNGYYYEYYSVFTCSDNGDCPNINHVFIGNEVQVVPDYAFQGCDMLLTLEIPSSVYYIGVGAFRFCHALTSLSVMAESPPSLDGTAFDGVSMDIPVYVLCESAEAYQSVEGWNAFTNMIGLCTSATISVMADPIEGGLVSGSGTYDQGAICTLTATANNGYTFVNWTENNVVVSRDSDYTFTVTCNRSLTAHFVSEGNVVFADAAVKAICVANWDSNGDGELSYAEAAAVADLGTAFSENMEITSFDELQYFIGLAYIRDNAFVNCSNLTGLLIIPNSVINICSSAFENCSQLTGPLVIPNSVAAIEYSAFYGCSGFTGNLAIPSSVTSIGNYCFANCSGFTGNLAIPSSVAFIGDYSFSGCCGLTSVFIPYSVTSIGSGSFQYCSNLEQIEVEAGNTVYDSRENCNAIVETNLNKLVSGCMNTIIPNSVTAINDHAFRGMTGLVSILIPNSVTALSLGTFQDCSSMVSVTISASLSSISPSAFAGCSGLVSMVVLALNPPRVFFSAGDDPDAFEGISPEIPIYVPCGSVEAYQSALKWSYFSNIIGACAPGTITVSANPTDGGTVTGSGIFDEGTLCTVSAIPNEGYCFVGWRENDYFVSFQSHYCFGVAYDRELTAWFVPDGNIVFADSIVKAICVQNWDLNEDGELSYIEAAMVTDLGQVFSENEEITSFEELQYFICLKTIGDFAFWHCSNLSGTLHIPNSVVSIGASAFEWCSSLSGDLIIPNSVKTIGSYAFWLCYGFSGSLFLSNSMTVINYGAFMGCSGFVGTLAIPDHLTSIEGRAFNGCSGFTGDLSIPNSVSSIGEFAFAGCSGFTGDLVIPNAITSISRYAFADCSGLTGSLLIPSSVNTIGSYSFAGCSNLTSVTIPETVISVGYLAFIDCDGLAFMRILAETPPTIQNNQVIESGSTTITLMVPCGSVEAYNNADGWNVFPVIGMCGPVPIDLSADPVNGGAVYGAGYYELGSICSVTATPNQGYYFWFWMEDGAVVSALSDYSFIVTGNRNLSALFSTSNPVGVIQFADPSVKSICVQQWDINGDDELSYYEAAAVANLEDVFAWNGEITSFDELQFFTGLTSIGNNAFAGCSVLTSVIIPNSVTTIGDYAFNESGLSSLSIGSSVASIGQGVVWFCDNLEQIVVDTGNPYFDSRDNCNAIIETENNSLIIGCKNTVVPNTVTSIGDFAFYQKYVGFTSINIPNSVTTIGNYAFYNCYNLSTIEIPESMSYIGECAFGDCSGLNSLFVYADAPPTLGNEAFYAVHSDMPVYVPCGSVESYQSAEGWNGFSNIVGLLCYKTITVAASPAVGGVVTGTGTYMGGSFCTVTATANENYTFLYWTENGTVVSLETSFSFIVTRNRNLVACFAEDSSICEVLIDLYDDFGYEGWEGNYLVVDYGNGVLERFTVESGPIASFSRMIATGSDITLSWIEGLWVQRCSFDISYGNGIQIYHGSNLNSGFQYQFVVDCSAAYSQHIISAVADPEEGGTVSGSGEYGYYSNCTLTAIPNEGYVFLYWEENGEPVTTEAEYTFIVTHDRTLTAFFDGIITFADSNVKSICVDNWDANGDGELSYAEAAEVTSLENVFAWNEEITSFDELQYFVGLESIEDEDFWLCSALASIIIPSTVSSIGESAFSSCSGLTAVMIPASVASIGDRAFANCSGLEQIVVDEENAVYDSRSNCNAIIETATNTLFFGCMNTTIPNTVTAIYDEAFAECIGLTSIVIPNSVTSIGEYAFGGSGLTTIEIPASVTSIEVSPFAYCGGLEQIVVDAGNMVYDSRGNCNAIIETNTNTLVAGCMNTIIPESVITIEAEAFEGCEGLTSIEIPNSVVSIGSYAFGWCSELSSVVVNAEVPPTMGMGVFEDVNSEIPVRVPCGVLGAYQAAAGWNTFTNIQEDCNQLLPPYQTIELEPGWNWCSYYIGISMDELKEALVATGNDYIIIKSLYGNATYIRSRWTGMLNSLDFAQMYKIQVEEGCEISFEGTPIDPLEYPITINPGGNWFGYISTRKSITAVFANFSPDEGNKIISQDKGFAIFENGSWKGTLRTLEPGKGYVYVSNATEPKTLVIGE